ncbi:MAG: DUF4382 domain-containing protein [Bacteroidetes bacterium]|nr:DUF4382 domain-containing protein [Bacteroidota bacterium]
MKQTTKMTSILLAATCIMAACQKEKGTGFMNIRMVDVPVNFDEVNVEVEQIKVHHSGSGWLDLATNAGVYDLLDLQNGVSAALVTGEELPVGHLTQMRLILGDDNTVMVDSTYFPLILSSQDKSGLKLNLNTDIDVNDSVEVVFDFDAEKSIVIEGNNTFRLKPVLHLESVLFF